MDPMLALITGQNVSDQNYSPVPTTFPGSTNHVYLEDGSIAPVDRYHNAAQTVALGAASIAAATVETFGSSLSFGMLDDNFVEQYYKGSEFGDFYTHNKDWAKTVADLGTFFIPGTLAMKAVQKGSTAYKAMQGLGMTDKYANLIFTSGMETGTAMKMIQNRAVDFAKKTGTVDWSRTTGPAFWRDNAANLLKTGVVDSVKKNIAFELGVAATMHTSDTLFPDDWSVVDHVALGAPLIGAGVGLEYFFMRHNLGRIAQVAGEQGLATRFADQNLSELTAVSRWGQRDIALTQQSHLLYKLDEAQKNGALGTLNDAERRELNSNIAASKNIITGERDANIKLLATDKPYDTVTIKWDMGDRELSVVSSHLDGSPYDFLGVVSVEPISTTSGRAVGDFRSARQGRLNSLTREIKELRSEVTKAEARGDIADPKHLRELNAKRKEYKEIQQLTPVVMDPYGVKTDARQRGTIFQDYASPVDITQPPGKTPDDRRILIRSTNPGVRGISINYETLNITNFGAGEQFAKAEGGEYFLNGQAVGDKFGKYARPRSQEVEDEIIRRLSSGDTRAFTEANIDDETFYRQMSAQNLDQRTATYAGLEAYANSIEKQVREGTLAKPVYINPYRHYIYADLAAELHTRLGDEAFSQWVALPSNMKIDDAKFVGLAGKFRDYNVWMDMVTEQLPKKGKLPKNINDLQSRALGFTPVNFRHYTNLPQSEPGAVDPILDLFNSLRAHGDTDLKEGMENLNNLRVAANANKVAPEMAGPQTLTMPVDTQGHLLHWKMGENKSVLAVYRELPVQNQQTYQTMLDKAAQQRADIMQRMATAERSGAIIAQTVYNYLADSVGVQAATDIGTLGNGSQRGRGHITTRALSLGDAPALRGADQVDATLTPVQNKMISDILNRANYSSAASALRSDAVALQNFADFYNATRAGWDLQVAPEIQGEKALFLLDNDSKRNQRLWKQFFGKELDPEAKNYLPAPTKGTDYVPYAAVPTTLNMVNSIVDIGSVIEKETNHILRQTGKGAVTHRNFWIPSLNLANKDVSFIRRQDNGQLLYVASAKTPGQLRDIVSRTLAAYGENGVDAIEVPLLKEPNVFHAFDEAFDNMINFTDPLAQTGGISGRQKGPVVISGGEALEEIQKSVENILQNTFRRNRVLFFEPYVDHVRNLDSMVEATARTQELAGTPTKKWLNLIYGNATFDTQSPIGKTYSGIENFFDAQLAKLQERLSPTTDQRIAKQAKLYDAYAKALGEHNPYTDAVDFAQRTLPIDTPWQSRKIMSELNNITTALTLRLFELGQPLLNMVSLASTMPAVIKALQKNGNEDIAAWRRRIGSFGSVISEEQAQAVMNPMRIMSTAAHNMWNKKIIVDGKEVLLDKWARDQGFFAQSVSDMLDTYVRPHQSEFRRKLGDIVNVLSKPSDLSESFSRGLAFHGGWEVGEKLGIKENKNLAAFAHDFANRVIGDYRPQNRPMMFQGAAGMPLGLFTTFMWNYNERLFRYIESKNARAFYTQIATQASLFGANSVPGYSQFVNWFANNYDGTSNPATGIEERFGTTFADWWHYGTLSNLPKLFGYGADDGIALYQRGDAGLKTIPTLFNPTNTPVFTAIGKLYKGVSDVVTAVKNNGVEPKQIAQILAQNSISRPFRGLVEMYSGQSLDYNGRIISDDVQSTMGIISRIVDMRTLSEAKNAEAFYALGQSRYARQDRMTGLQDSMEYNFREGNVDGSVLADNLRAYIENGGNPSDFAQVMRNTMLTANMDRTTREIAKNLSGAISNKDVEDVKRLIWAQMPVTNSDLDSE